MANSATKSTRSANQSDGGRRFLIILVLFLALYLGLITQVKAKPIKSGRILTSKYKKYRKFIEALARYESGNYTNTLAREHNNIFSMGYPSKRKASNIGSTPLAGAGKDEPNLFSKYSSYDQAIKDLLLWFDYTDFPTNIGTLRSFVEALKDRGYFALPIDEYYQGIKSNFQNI